MVLLLCMPALAAPDDATALVERVRPSVVTLVTEDLFGRRQGNGTGFFVSADGLVATNEHVASAGPTVAVLHDGRRVEVLGVLVADEETDLAVLRVAGAGYPALPLGPAEPPVVRDPVLVVGSPTGLDHTVTEGVITALRPDGVPPDVGAGVIAGGPIVQFDAAIAPGSSGSPVVTPRGEVLAIAQSVDLFERSSFGVDVKSLQALLARAPADGSLEPMASAGRQLAQVLAFVGVIVAAWAAPGFTRWVRGRVARLARRSKRRLAPRE